MPEKLRNPICPSPKCAEFLQSIRDAIEVISGKWKAPIIVSLLFGNKRFNELEKEITGITPKMLSKELRDLELNLLVRRTVYDSIPVTVEYSLTPYGKSLKKVMQPLREWGSNHRKEIRKKR
jgi:DNA-binding HxlR family transcriptional regulator